MSALTDPRVARAARFLNQVGLQGVNRAGKRALRFIKRDRLSIAVDGLRIEGPFASSRILTQVAAGTYEVFETSLFKSSLSPGMIVVDLGANVGYYSLIAARSVGESGHVFAFEPDPRTLQFLHRNVALNGFRNITVVGKGASDSDGRSEMYLDSSAHRSSLHASASAEHVERREVIQTTTVDRVLNGLKADVVKMDIEGSEPAALRGMQSSLKSETLLFMEFSPPVLVSSGNHPGHFRRVLIDQFDTIEVIGRDEMLPFELSSSWYVNLRCSGWHPEGHSPRPGL